MKAAQLNHNTFFWCQALTVITTVILFVSPAAAQTMTVRDCQKKRNFRELVVECPIETQKVLPVKRCRESLRGSAQRCHWVMQSVTEKNSRLMTRERNPYVSRSF